MFWMLLSISAVDEIEYQDIPEVKVEVIEVPFKFDYPLFTQCSGSCSISCPITSCAIRCTIGRPFCYCNPDGYAVCGCNTSCVGPDTQQRDTTNSNYDTNSLQEHSLIIPKTQFYKGFYTIYDISGRKVFEGKLSGKLPDLKKGVYFLKSEYGKVRKVVVR